MVATQKQPLISTVRGLFALGAILIMFATGCPSMGPSGGLSDAADPPADGGEAAEEATAKTLVGQVEGSLTLVGLVTDGEKVIAYVCDGDDGPRSVSQWYEGTLDERGLFWLEPAGGYGSDTGYGVGPDGSSSPLWGILDGEFATGVLIDADGRQLTWAAELVADDTAAGLYIGDDGEVVASLVVLNEQFALGLARTRTTQTRATVTTPTRMPPRSPIPVQTAGRQVTTNALRTPVDLRAGRIVEVRVPPSPMPPSVPDSLPPPVKLAAPPNAIQIKFREGLRVRLREGADRPADENGRALVSAAALALLDEVSGGTWVRSHIVDERTLDGLRERGQQRSGKPLPDLNLYFNLRLPADLRAADYAARFRRLPEVEWASVMPDYYLADAPNLANPVPDSPFSPYQRYLDPAPVGVDARYAWGFAGGDGSGVQLVAIEYFYDVEHVDLPSITILLDPTNAAEPPEVNHGTATLGVIAARDNGMGVTGIAHGAEIFFTPVTIDPSLALVQTLGLDNFIIWSVVAQALEPGDVLVLEQQMQGPVPANPSISSQYGMVAVEWNKAVFDAIRIATANGLVVVEAAGNGYQNLDAAVYRDVNLAPHQPFRVDNGQRFNDSGAIIVGAGASGASWSAYPSYAAHERLLFSNYGGRVDVHAWGDAVVTAGPGHLAANTILGDGPHDVYRRDYSGTSSATAIIGGTVAAFQGFHKASFGVPYSPSGIRTWLRSTGTAQAGNTAQNIGRMPNLRAAIDQAIANFGPPAVPPEPELVQIGCQMPEIYYPDSDCVSFSPLPPPSWSLPSGAISQEALAFVRPIFPSPAPASSLIQYTLDGSLPAMPAACNADPSCATRHWVPVLTNNCASIAPEVPQFTQPLICRARLLNEAICEPDGVSPTVTRVYVPQGFINEPLFNRGTVPVAPDLGIRMRTGYAPNYPEGYAFVAFSLDGTEPVFGPDAPNGVNSRVWTDTHDSLGMTISIFANTTQNVVTLKARNYLVIGGEYVPGEVVQWTYVRD